MALFYIRGVYVVVGVQTGCDERTDAASPFATRSRSPSTMGLDSLVSPKYSVCPGKERPGAAFPNADQVEVQSLVSPPPIFGTASMHLC